MEWKMESEMEITAYVNLAMQIYVNLVFRA